MSQQKTQTRGICQCCGNEQAVLKSGKMSQHGYTVNYGYFNGVCSGRSHKPLQQDRKEADIRIASALEQAAQHEQRAEDLRSGKIVPTEVRGRFVRRGMVAWADADQFEREDGVRTAIYQEEQKARWGREFAQQLSKLADAVHGTPLKAVKLAEAPAPVLVGEKRYGKNDSEYTCVEVRGQRVYYTWKRYDGKVVRGWYGIAAWRKLETA